MKNKPRKSKYWTIPVSHETYEKIQMILETLKTSKRAQGALVGKLVDNEFDNLVARKGTRTKRRTNSGWDVLMPDGSWMPELSVLQSSETTGRSPSQEETV